MITMTGYNELLKTIRNMPAQFSHPLLQSIHFEALKPFVSTAKTLAPRKTGATQKSIGTQKPGIKRVQEIGLVISGPRRGRFGGNKAHLLEFGTKIRRTKSRANRGKISKRPFIQPAWDRTRDQVLRDITDKSGKVVANYMRRTLKRYG